MFIEEGGNYDRFSLDLVYGQKLIRLDCYSVYDLWFPLFKIDNNSQMPAIEAKV